MIRSWKRWLLTSLAGVARILGLTHWVGSAHVGGHADRRHSASSTPRTSDVADAFRHADGTITNDTPFSAAANRTLERFAENSPWPRQSGQAAYALTAGCVSALITDDAGTRRHTVTVANPTAFPVAGNAALGVEKDAESGTLPRATFVTGFAFGSGSYSEMIRLSSAGMYRVVRALRAGVGCSPYRSQM